MKKFQLYINMNKNIKLLAKPVIKNKFWIVEDCGKKVGTIQVHPEGVSFVKEGSREKFPSVKILSAKYNIKFEKSPYEKKTKPAFEVYGYPSDSKAFHTLWDVLRNLPIFTKSNKSKSYYCAGYYLIQIENHWDLNFCPKLITVNRYKFLGPFVSKELALEQLKKQNV